MANRWLITGASGQLGGHLVTHLRHRHPDEPLLALAGRQPVPTAAPADTTVRRIPLTEPGNLAQAVADFRPTHVIHTAALTAVGACHGDPDLARRCNVDATGTLADAAGDCGARFVFTSTDMVFRGDGAPYGERDRPDAESVYGQSKIAAERVLAGRDGVAVVRIPLLFGLPVTSRDSTFRGQLAGLRAGEPLRMFADEWRTPVSLRATAAILLGLAASEEVGLWHLAGPRRMSRLDLLLAVAGVLGLGTEHVEPISRLSIDGPEPRPEDLSLDGARLAARFPDLRPGLPVAEDLGA